MVNKPLSQIAYWILTLVLCVFFLVFVEGASSILVAINEAIEGSETIEMTKYDAKLGWTGIPSAFSPDQYGPGIYVRTNARGFRNESETQESTPQGKLRIICTGDSNTYGQGVSNDQTWCHLLSILDPRIDVINLGIPGYGIDQMYLRYLQEGMFLEHEVHIFAFISGDLDRMGHDNKNGFGKPKLRLVDERLEATGQPVPKLKWDISRAVARANLRAVDVGQRVIRWFAGPLRYRTTADPQLKVLAPAVFQAIQRIGEQQGVLPFFVFLPVALDIPSDRHWYSWLKDSETDLGVPLIDLTPDLRAVSARDAALFFIPENAPAGGHYSEAGNKWVAEMLYARLLSLSAVRKRLDELP